VGPRALGRGGGESFLESIGKTSPKLRHTHSARRAALTRPLEAELYTNSSTNALYIFLHRHDFSLKINHMNV